MRLVKLSSCLLLGLMTGIWVNNLQATNVVSDKALHLDWLDTKVAPGQNFFKFANGTWQKQNPIPPEYASWGSFYVLQEKMLETIHQMVINAANNKQAKLGSLQQKVGDFYTSGMDEKNINQLGVKPLAAEFERINAINNLENLQATITHLQMQGVNALFNFGSMQDFQNSNQMIGAALQGGLGLPDRDYYLKKEEKFQQIRAAYVQHIANMFSLLGDNPMQAADAARIVMDIETTLAKASMSQIEQRDPHAIYHMMDKEQLKQFTPYFSWSNYFRAIEQPTIKAINLAMPNFFAKVNEMLHTISLNDWKIYLRWQLIDSYAPYLSDPFVNENFHMNSVLTGTEKLLPRWKRVVNTENQALGFAIGKLYVEKYFPPASRQQVLEILNNIRQALKQDLASLSWMTAETRKAALQKLALMADRVGYPDKWWDYSKLIINRGPYVLNVIRANQFLIKRDLAKIGKPIDRSEWSMTPQTINAYYDPSMNNINLPAGILQAPFFDPNAPASINYGAIGFVIGHEITHGFDDQGSQFDGQGNLKNWWTDEDLKKFHAATNCITEQYSNYKVDDDLPLQGKLVVGEATADLGGLTLAYRAFRASPYYKQGKIIHGYTPDQQFFLGAAHIWASNIRPQQLRNLITTDPHPPSLYRVNGTVANMPEFQAAFGIAPGSEMVNKARCIIW